MSTVNLVCEECGSEFKRVTGEYNRNLRIGRGIFCSLQCAGKSNVGNFGDNRNTDTSHLDPANQRDEFSDFRYYERKARARMNKSQCFGSDLTLEQIKFQWDKQQGRCAYTNIPLHLWRDKGGKKLAPWKYASLDRIDSSLPYTASNVQFVSANINFLKHDMSHENTLKLISLIRSPN